MAEITASGGGTISESRRRDVSRDTKRADALALRTEIEAKYLMRDNEQLAALLEALRSLDYDITPGPTRTLVDRYYDTRQWHIATAGWAFRLRTTGDQSKLVLKSLTDQSSMSERRSPVRIRDEIEQYLLSTPALAELPSGPVTRALESILGDAQIRELFQVVNSRTTYEVCAAGSGSLIQLAMDEVQILPHRRFKQGEALRFRELELEVIQGRASALETLVAKLPRNAAVVPARLSKFERGLQAAGLTFVEPREAGEPISRQVSAVHLAYRHLGDQLRVIQREEPKAWEGLHPEGVHRMRVGTRRMRAALKAFKDILSPRAVAAFQRDFKWLGKVLGQVRDLDVYRGNLDRYGAEVAAADIDALDRYRAFLDDDWQKARRRLRGVLSSRRYKRLLERMERFVAQGPSRSALKRSGFATVAEAAPLYVTARLTRVTKIGRSITRNSSPEALHSLRIQVKRLRYLLEFLAPAYGGRLGKGITAAKRLQDLLGEYQDACVASERLRAYSEKAPARGDTRDLLITLGQLIHSQRCHAARVREAFPVEWRRFRKSASRKKLLAAVE